MSGGCVVVNELNSKNQQVKSKSLTIDFENPAFLRPWYRLVFLFFQTFIVCFLFIACEIQGTSSNTDRNSFDDLFPGWTSYEAF